MKKLSAALLLTLLATSAFAESNYDKPGYSTKVENGRLWVFTADSPAIADFEKNGEPEKSFSAIGAGPDGMTVRAASVEVLDGYLAK